MRDNNREGTFQEEGVSEQMLSNKTFNLGYAIMKKVVSALM